MDAGIATLRELCARYYEIALGDQNREKIRLHKNVNDMKPSRPVVLIDEIPWEEMEPREELMPVCADPYLREVETGLRRSLYKLKYMPADMILPDFLGVQKIVSTDAALQRQYTDLDKSRQNVDAHQFKTQFQDDEDIEKLRFETITYNEGETMRRYELLSAAVGDILPIKLMGGHISFSPWDFLSQYMSLDDMMFMLVDKPEFIHKLVGRLTGIYLHKIRQYEAMGLLEGDHYYLHCTPALTDDLQPDRTHVKLSQVWGRAAAQIFDAVSPRMHDEFDIQYMCRALEPFGLVYYGCCEALDRKIDIVSKIPRLRKISVTPWADVDVAADAIAGRYVVSAKPNPSYVAADSLDEDVIRRELRRIVAACRRNNCACDIVIKDITTVNGRSENLFRWEQIAMEIVQG